MGTQFTPLPRKRKRNKVGSPVVPFLTPFFGEGSPTKIDYRRKKGKYPYSNLSTGGPREEERVSGGRTDFGQNLKPHLQLEGFLRGLEVHTGPEETNGEGHRCSNWPVTCDAFVVAARAQSHPQIICCEFPGLFLGSLKT